MREKYREKYCKILEIELPQIFDVHHIDLNRKNNDITNLVAIPCWLHREYHQSNMMQYPSSALMIPVIPPAGHYFKTMVDDLNEFYRIFHEIEKWIDYREHLRFDGYPNRYNLSYSEKITT